MNPHNPPLVSSTETLYPIRHVADITGVNPVTLRAWERRYGLIKPTRTPKGHRLYSDADIQRVQAILALLDRGVAISQTRHHLENTVEPERGKDGEFDKAAIIDGNISPFTEQLSDEWVTYINRMRAAAEAFDGRALDRVFNDVTSLYPLELAARSLLLPLLKQLYMDGILKQQIMAAYQFVNVFFRGKLSARLHHLLQQKQATGKRLIFAGVGCTQQEVELLLSSLVVINHGYSVLYMGINEVVSHLPAIAQASSADGLVITISAADALSVAKLNELAGAVAIPVFIQFCDLYVGSQNTEWFQYMNALVDRLGWTILDSRLSEAVSQLSKTLNS